MNKEKQEGAPGADFTGLSVEDAFKRLREILAGLEKEDLSLEESFAGYEEGVRLVRYCSSRIDDVEKKVQKMNEDGSLEDF